MRSGQSAFGNGSADEAGARVRLRCGEGTAQLMTVWRGLKGRKGSGSPKKALAQITGPETGC
jgi:hypothetical protein